MNIIQRQSLNTKAILCLVAAVAFLAVSDAVIKWLSPNIALHEIMLFRSLFAMLVMPLIFKLEGGIKTIRTRRPGLHFIRGSMLVFANMFFFLGLASMPFAETVALFFTAPLFICLLSRPVLGEKVGLSRWLVIFLGMAGVVIMLRPGAEVFRTTSLLPIVAALCYAGMQMLTRKLGMQESAGTMTLYIQLAFISISTLVGLGIGDGRFNSGDNQTLEFLLRAWVWPDIEQFKLLALCGLMVTIGGYLLTQAYRMGQAAVVAPFEYTAMPFALLVGYYLWGDWPDIVSFIGSGFIIFSGLVIVYLENRNNRKKPMRPAQIDY